MGLVHFQDFMPSRSDVENTAQNRSWIQPFRQSVEKIP